MGSTDNFFPGKVKAALVADACCAAADPDAEPAEVIETLATGLGLD